MHILERAAEMIEERGLEADPTRTYGPNGSGITLHQALRMAAGLHPEAWLGAYAAWRESTRQYQVARNALDAEVVRRAGRLIEVTVWARQVDQAEVLSALADAAAASPGAEVPEAPPVFRPGCHPSRKASVKYNGVIAAALVEAVRANPGTTVAAASSHAASGNLAACSLDDFLDRLDVLVASGESSGEVGSDAVLACKELLAATQESGSLVPRVLAEVLALGEERSDEAGEQIMPDDGELAGLLVQYKERVKAAKGEQRLVGPIGDLDS